MGKRRTYSEQFKREAVELSFQENRTAKEVAEELGTSYNNLIRWRNEYKEKDELAFPGQGNQKLSPEEQKIKELKKELRAAQEERDILKKAVAIFSKKPK